MNKIRPNSQKGKRLHFDAIVLGGGISGLCYALRLAELNPSSKIAIFVKTTFEKSNSAKAQGGIAAIQDKRDKRNKRNKRNKKNDSLELHIKDTLIAGDGLTRPDTARIILAQGPDALRFLNNHGVVFDYGNLAKEGGHSRRRIHHIRDCTGLEIMRALQHAIKIRPAITLFENHVAVNLITKEELHKPGILPEVLGAYILDTQNGVINTVLAKATVLATGGAGKVYRYTSNLDIATGDGIAMAYRAGARIGNLEFYQFHPTLLYHHEIQDFLLTEALRGEGAYLRHPKTLKRFMQHYAPQAMELATRDIVARAIFNEIEHSDSGYMYLDMRHFPSDYLQKRFPTIFNQLSQLGMDLSKDLIPIVPAAHYLCGGILTDTAGVTDLRRLYAIGETACTGLHGANRLASNSLLEGVVTAIDAAMHSSSLLKKRDVLPFKSITDWDSNSVIDLRRASQIHAHWLGLRGEMTSYAGIIRTKAGLKDLLRLIRARRVMIEDYYWKHSITRDLIELRNIALVAELIVRSALNRCESRGGHYREDYPSKNKVAKESIIQEQDTEVI